MNERWIREFNPGNKGRDSKGACGKMENQIEFNNV